MIFKAANADHERPEWVYLEQGTRTYIPIPDLPRGAPVMDAVRWAQAHGIKTEQLHLRAAPPHYANGGKP